MTLATHPSATEDPAFITPEEGAFVSAEGDISAQQRRCLATGESFDKQVMIRFVVGPDHVVVPDMAGRLPGRGLWVRADRDALDLAIRKNLFSRAAKQSVTLPNDLLATVETLLARRCLDLLGLCKSAGQIVAGQAQVEQILKEDNLAFVVIAADAGADGPKKLGRARQIRDFDRGSLGKALGRDHIVYIGLRPHALSEKLVIELNRWQGVKKHEQSAFNPTGN